MSRHRVCLNHCDFCLDMFSTRDDFSRSQGLFQQGQRLFHPAEGGGRVVETSRQNGFGLGRMRRRLPGATLQTTRQIGSACQAVEKRGLAPAQVGFRANWPCQSLPVPLFQHAASQFKLTPAHPHQIASSLLPGLRLLRSSSCQARSHDPAASYTPSERIGLPP